MALATSFSMSKPAQSAGSTSARWNFFGRSIRSFRTSLNGFMAALHATALGLARAVRQARQIARLLRFSPPHRVQERRDEGGHFRIEIRRPAHDPDVGKLGILFAGEGAQDSLAQRFGGL